MKAINKIILALFVIVTFSCDDVLEKDITNSQVQAAFPLNGSTVISSTVVFRWNELEGAEKYRVQIFDINQILVKEEAVAETSYSFTFQTQGQFTWRVRAENFAYTSSYSLPMNFTVQFTNDLTNQLVTLTAPANDKFLNFINVTLNWQAMPNAASYSIEVINFGTGQQVFTNPTVTGTSVTLNVPTLIDGVYEWKVKAKNATTETLNYTARKFAVDRVNPNQPIALMPNNNTNQVINQSLSFTWSIPSDSGTVQSPITYIFEYANDVNFTNPQITDVSGTSFNQSFSATGTYYWRVKAKDGAGNIGSPSSPFKFTI